MSDIFLSYERRDLDRVKVLAAALESQGWSVFFDLSIPPGKTWREFIEKEIDKCRCMVVAWSTYSVDSHWVCEEADIGRQRKILVPLLLDQVKPPLGFVSIQAASLVGWQGKTDSPGYFALCRAVTERIGPGIASISGVDKAIHQPTNVPKNAKIRWSKQLTVKVGKITSITTTLAILLWYLIPGLLNPKKDTITVNRGNATYQQDKQEMRISDHPRHSIEKIDLVENDSKLVDQKRKSEQSIENIQPKPEIKPEDSLKQALVFYGMKRFTEALPLFMQLAKDGNPEAQHKLGLMYENGNGSDRNLDKAISWYEKAAQLGLAKSQFNLGSLYLRERQDKNQALYWFKQAAEQQYPNAEFNLGVFYATGELGLDKDVPKAKKWLRLAEQHGYKDAGKYLSLLGK